MIAKRYQKNDKRKRRKIMPLVAAKCPNCGGNLEVDPTKEAAVCPFCGTPYITEKAINNYNIHNNVSVQQGTVAVQGENVKVFVGDKNIDSLVKLGKSEKEANELLKISKDILKIDASEFYGYFFAFKADGSFCKEAIEHAQNAEELSELTDEIISKARMAYFGILDVKTNPKNATLFLETKGYDTVPLAYIKYFVDNKARFGDADKKKIVDFVNALNQNLLDVYKLVLQRMQLFYYSDESVTTYEYKAICTTANNLAFFVKTLADFKILVNKAKLQEVGKQMYAVLESNKSVLFKERIYAKMLIDNVSELAGVSKEAHMLASTNQSFGVVISGKKDCKVKIGYDYLEIIRPGFTTLKVAAKDCFTVNLHYIYSPGNEFFKEQKIDVSWVLFRVGTDSVSAIQFSSDVTQYYSVSDDPFFSALSTWCVTNNVNLGHEKWNALNLPIKNGYNGLKYIDPYKGQVSTVSGKTSDEEYDAVVKTNQKKVGLMKGLVITFVVLAVVAGILGVILAMI